MEKIQSKWWFSIAMLNYQRVSIYLSSQWIEPFPFRSHIDKKWLANDRSIGASHTRLTTVFMVVVWFWYIIIYLCNSDIYIYIYIHVCMCIYTYIYIFRVSLLGVPPNHPLLDGIFHEINHPAMGGTSFLRLPAQMFPPLRGHSNLCGCLKWSFPKAWHVHAITWIYIYIYLVKFWSLYYI